MKCPRCSDEMSAGRLIGGQGWLFWHAPPFRTGLLGFKKGLDILRDPRPFLRRALKDDVSAERCERCRLVQFAY